MTTKANTTKPNIVALGRLQEFCIEALRQCGASEDHARITTDAIAVGAGSEKRKTNGKD